MTWEDKLDFHHIYFDQFELQIQRHGYTGLISEDVLSQEVERVPIKVKDFSNEKSVTYKYMFHPLIFTWEPTFRFETRKLLMLGFLLCSHKSNNHARDSLWGLMNPNMKFQVTRTEAKEFMQLLAQIATELPFQYYAYQETVRD